MEVPGSASGVFIFECIASEASLPTHSRREHSEDLWISLWTSTTQERSATCSSTARMVAKPSTITFRSPGLSAPWTKGHWDPGAFGLFPYFKNEQNSYPMQNPWSARAEQCESCANVGVLWWVYFKLKAG